MPAAAEPVNLHQTGPQIACLRASGFCPFRRGEGDPIGEDGISNTGHLLVWTNMRCHYTRGLWQTQRALWGGRLGSASDFAGSVGGAPLSSIRQYIAPQDTPEGSLRGQRLISPP